MGSIAPNSPVADWVTQQTGDHFGNYYDLVTGLPATVTRATPKTIYDPNTGRIHDVPADSLAVNPWSAYQTGGFGFAAVIEEARTNYLVNSYGAANTAGKWDGYNYAEACDGTPTPSIVPGLYGQTAQRVTYAGLPGETVGYFVPLSVYTAVGSFAAGEAGTLSTWLKGASSGVPVQLRLYGYQDSTNVGMVFINATLTSAWARAAVSYASLPTGTNKCRMYLVCDGIAAGESIDITMDAVQLEKGAFATSYIPTTTAAVTRNADVVTVPTTGWSAAAGTMVGVRGVRSFDAYLSRLLHWIADANNHIGLADYSAGRYLAHLGAATNAGAAILGAANTVAVRGGTWQTGAVSLTTANGVSGLGTVNAVTPEGLPATASIGSYNGSEVFNGPIARATIYATALTAAQLAEASMTSELLAGYKGNRMAAKLLAIGVL
jgi:hypothetical protein